MHGITKENSISKDFTTYTIKQGEHYCDGSALINVEYELLNFIVKFDSSAIYKTKEAVNQADINKLYGFSDNNEQHHKFSARFGWCWNNSSISLFGYTYNNGERSAKFLDSIKIGTQVYCAIKVSADKYIFSVGDKVQSMPRLSKTTNAKGYKLFPYFGGDELAPHDIRIWIKEIQ